MSWQNTLFCILSFCTASHSQNYSASRWADSVLATMSLDEKLGQLFVIRSFSTQNEQQIQDVSALIQDYHIGGICFFKGTSGSLYELIQKYQKLSKIPVMVSMDAEWGLGMRITDAFSFPKQMSLGALKENRLIYDLGKEMAIQMKLFGIHMNYAPVLDINNNLNNPVINERSFGSNRQKVLLKSIAFLQGLQDHGVLACVKHFPGHGDTDLDSHKDLPVLNFSRKRLDSLELYPFEGILNARPAGMMIAHLKVPVIDSSENIPASLSKEILNGILQKRFHYKGLLITDALEMKGVTKNFNAGEIAVKALSAGNDLLLLSENIPAAFQAIKMGIDSNILNLKEIDQKVKRILIVKHTLGLNAWISEGFDSISYNKSIERSIVLKDKIYRKTLTLARDSNKLVPIRKIPFNISCVSINDELNNVFQSRLQDYSSINTYSMNSVADCKPEYLQAIENSELIIVSIHKLNYQSNKNYGVNIELLQQLNKIIANKKCIVVLFGCPYVSMFLPASASIVLAYEDNERTQDISAQMIFGTDPIVGVSPVNTNSYLKEGFGINRPALHRMGFAIPESMGLSSSVLNKIDSIAGDLIQNHAAPGCQIVIAKDEKIVYRKSFGYFDYDSTEWVDNKTIYDLASLTKIIGSAPVLMSLVDQNKIETSSRISKYIPEFRNSEKQNISLKDVLLHQAKFVSWIPFYKNTLKYPDSLNILNPTYYDTAASIQFNIPICKNIYLKSDYRDSMLMQIIQSKSIPEKKYWYSDIGFYFMPNLVHATTGLQFENYFEKTISNPLNLRYTCFNPLNHYFSESQIAPTEIDTYFRHQKIQGYVHDMGAAMMGGISGHAGLFSNASEVAVLMQLFLNLGTYADQEFFSSSTVTKFIKRDLEFGKRALVFDMPDLRDSTIAYVSNLASKKTFGHQGFTGTCAWADPVNNIVYVFLSNRTYPDSKQNLLHKNRYRTKIQDQIYKALIPPETQTLK